METVKTMNLIDIITDAITNYDHKIGIHPTTQDKIKHIQDQRFLNRR